MLAEAVRGCCVPARSSATVKERQPDMKFHVSLLPDRCRLAALALVASFQAVCAGDKQPPTIVVAKTQAQGIGHWQPAMGDGLAQMMITELNKLDNVKVLESVALDDLRAERKLGESGEVAADEAVKKGQWKGADYTFKSVVTRFVSKESIYGGGVGGLPVARSYVPLVGGFSVKKSENEVQIDWRIVDNATREVVKGASGSAVGMEKGGGFNFNSWGGGGFADNREFMDSALGKATVKAVAQIVGSVKALQLSPGARSTQAAESEQQARAALRKIRGTVELVDGKEIWVSLGTKNHFAKGDKIKLYQPIEKKNQQGKVILTTYNEVGEIELIKVQKDKGMGVYSGSATINEGWTAVDAGVDIDSLE
jgi:curli biogenesis system outer membrane secretion channel CsgG